MSKILTYPVLDVESGQVKMLKCKAGGVIHNAIDKSKSFQDGRTDTANLMRAKLDLLKAMGEITNRAYTSLMEHIDSSINSNIELVVTKEDGVYKTDIQYEQE